MSWHLLEEGEFTQGVKPGQGVYIGANDYYYNSPNVTPFIPTSETQGFILAEKTGSDAVSISGLFKSGDYDNFPYASPFTINSGSTIIHIFDINTPAFCFKISNTASSPVVSGEVIGTGDGTTTSFSDTLAHPKVYPGTLTVHYTISSTDYTATDDGNGNISGTDCSGTINYDTGAISLTFTTAPDNGTNITADYDQALTFRYKVYAR